HAAGVVICGKVIKENVPLARSGEDIVTQFDMKEIEQLGMLKMDFLALKTLTDIKKACDYIYEDYGVKIDFQKIGYDEKVAFDLIGSGDTDAIFQLESGGMKRFMRELKPGNLEDIIAGISLYRPGPMKAIPDYIRNKNNPDKIVYDTPLLEPLLKVTYGVIIYQEQVMNIVQALAGYSLGQADLIRRAMGKKHVEEMKRQREFFIHGQKDENGNVIIEGAVARGVPEDKAAKIFDDMADFAKYAFNKSHAAAYAVVAYQTAYLKALYPQEFLTAVLNNRIDNISEITKYVLYLKERGIKVLPPDINKSKAYFSVEGKAVRIGLVAIKGVGRAAIDSIIEEREKNGEYKSFEDFIGRSDARALNKRLVENMILAGAFDRFKIYRSRLMQVSGELIDMASIIAKQRESAQMSLFGTLIEETPLTVKYPVVDEYDDKTRLNNEKAVLGVFLSGHPLEKYVETFKRYSFDLSVMNDYEEDEDGKRTYTGIEDGQQVRLGGLITAINKKTTKHGQGMAFLTLEDVYGSIEIVLFPKVYDRYKDKAELDAIVEVTGKLQLREDEKPSISVDKISLIEEESAPRSQKSGYASSYDAGGIIAAAESPAIRSDMLCVVLDDESLRDEVIDVISSYPGEVVTYLKINGRNYKLDFKCRDCNGIRYELMGLVDKKNIIFVKKQ
ncbi:MAG: DNA polymerase III subunit alpha, partial [Clostridia bacterium]|nr:DNA polymerase III subunit alpha [Clostridia bacterium]